ncbi:MAG: hypothetical protein E6G94_09045 [Alphaproteobacteria bacterium]|nr:MAG: hypothetical protein E6G94_09045 [Alphaproteobacteria bacterium]
MRHLILFAAAVALPVSAAAAGEPVYFYKAAVEREAFAGDLAQCLDLAKGVQAPRMDVPYSPNLYAVAVGAFLAGLTRSRERRHMIDNVLRTCMSDKGYRRVEATKALGKELDGLAEKERVERFYTLASAAEPVGEVLPQ